MRGAGSFRFILLPVFLGACQTRPEPEPVPPVAAAPAAAAEPTEPTPEPAAPEEPLWPSDPDDLIDHMNRWDRARLQTHARQMAGNEQPSDSETAKWVTEHVQTLNDQGVSIRWSDYGRRYMRKGPSKPMPAGAVIKPCKRKHAPRKRKKSREYVDDIEVGCTEPEVLAAHGEPSVRDRNTWTYAFPEHCSDFRTTVTVVFQDGKVATVDRNSSYTGDHCEIDM